VCKDTDKTFSYLSLSTILASDRGSLTWSRSGRLLMVWRRVISMWRIWQGRESICIRSWRIWIWLVRILLDWSDGIKIGAMRLT
jgi:hypothetical protein